MLGRPLQNTSSAEQTAVSRAALALGLRGGNFVSERLNRRLVLDEFGIGLFDPVCTLELRYEITSRWRLVTESSSESSGGDLIFNVERSSD